MDLIKKEDAMSIMAKLDDGEYENLREAERAIQKAYNAMIDVPVVPLRNRSTATFTIKAPTMTEARGSSTVQR